MAIEERRRTLEKYMIDLSSNQLVTATSVWKDFIEENTNISSIQSSPLQEIKDKENKKQSFQGSI